MSQYRAVFTTDGTPLVRQKAEIAAIENGMRLGDDDLVYNAYGIAVARFLGHDGQGNLRFENLRLETEWTNAKVLRGEGDGYTGSGVRPPEVQGHGSN